MTTPKPKPIRPPFSMKRTRTQWIVSWGSFTAQAETQPKALQDLARRLVDADEHYLDLWMPPKLREAFKAVAEIYADAYQSKAAAYAAKAERVMAQGKPKRSAP